MRIRGELMVRIFDSTPHINGSIWAAYIALVSRDAIAAGTGSLPDPFTDEYDYLWYQTGWIGNELSAAATAGNAYTRQYIVDNKSRRKLNEGMGMVFKIVNSSSSFSDIAHQFGARFLYMR